MGAAPAYDAYPERAVPQSPRRAPLYAPSPSRRGRSYRTRADIRVTPGAGRSARSLAQEQQQRSHLLFVAKTVAVVLAIVAFMGVARVALITATVTTSMQSQALASQIDDAQSDNVALEASQSVLSSSSRIKSEAQSLGLAAPSETQSLTLSDDVVVTGDDGSISLSKSLAAVAEASE